MDEGKKTSEPEPAVAGQPVADAPGLIPQPPALMGPAGYVMYGPVLGPVPPPGRTGPRFSTPVRLVSLAVLNVVLLATLAVVLVGKAGSDDHRDAAAAPAGTTVPATPWDHVTEVLRESAAALTAGDEKGWLAAVDPGQPALQKRYRSIFTTLHALGLTTFEYRPGIYTQDPADPAGFTFQTEAFYCYGTDTCQGGNDVPTIAQKLTMKPVAGHYVITGSAPDPSTDVTGQTPWQDGALKLITGKRVVIGADQSEADLLPAALPLAEKAAAVADKFAKMMGTTQLKYRIYLAGTKQWKAWYGGEDKTWSSRSVALGQYGFDIIVNVAQVIDDADLQFLLQREMGWDVSLTGGYSNGADEAWLTEGVSEYIGYYPKPATSAWSFGAARKTVSSHGLTKINPSQPAGSASDATWNGFFGLAHLAVDCLAHEYGQQKAFTFVKQTLINSEDYDEAAQDAFALPFTTVNKTCVGWMKDQM